MVADTSRHGGRTGRARAVGLGLLLAGGLLAGRDAAPAGPQARPAKPVQQVATLRIPALLTRTGDAEQVRTINKLVAAKWQANHLTPSRRATDYEFIRRASLDLIGRIATPQEIHRFLRDPADSRRALLIERLLKSPEYARNFANLWTVLLMTRSGAFQPGIADYHEQMHRWLEDQFRDNKPWNQVVTELLTATGKTDANGAVNYILTHLGEPVPAANQEGLFDMVPVTSRTTRLFLGVQTQCTQCHDHPFNPGKQQNFWGINAFFRQVEPKGRRPMAGAARVRDTVLELRDDPALDPTGIISFENRKGLVMATKPRFFLDPDWKLPDPAVNRRQALAQLITTSPYFAKAYVNRLWAHCFGRGFTNPVDDFGEHNEPSNPELLDQLAADFAHYGYDTRRLLRWICNSEAYSLGSVANKTNESSDAEPFFSRMLLKAMTPEQLFESLVTATQAEMFESPENRRRLRRDWLRSLTVNFGDDEGNEATFNGTVVQALMLMNGKEINSAISSKEKGTVALAVVTKQTPRAILDYLYLAALNRPPTAREAAKVMEILRRAPVTSRDLLGPWQDVFWALLNSNEFILNH